MSKTTIVTMFFNLKKLKDASSSTRPLDFYVNNGLPTLGLEFPMVVFCDEETIDLIKSVRDKLEHIVPTVYIVKKLIDYDFYSMHFDIIEQNRIRSSGYKDPNNRNTTSYFLITMFKSVALMIAKQRNDFNTPFYAWVDLGCNHVLKNVSEFAPKMLENPNPKISACYIHYRSSEELKDMSHFLKDGGPCGMAATVFTAQTEYIERFYNAMMQLFHEQLSKGTGHSDEQTMTFCYDRYPELFQVYNGDYYSILTNYHSPTADLHAIKVHFIYNCINSHRFDLAREAIHRILDSLSKKTALNASESDLKEEMTHTLNDRLD
jgi:hypothetical protein